MPQPIVAVPTPSSTTMPTSMPFTAAARLRRPLVSVVAGLGGLAGLQLAAACHDDETTADELADVVFEAKTNDEALAAMLAAPPVDDPTQAAYLEAPADGATLQASDALTFRWRVGKAAASRTFTTPDQATMARLEHPAGPSLLPRSRAANGPWWSLLRAVAPIGVAHAHGTPVNGRAYFLVVTDANGAPLYRVFSLGFENVTSAAKRAELAAAAQPLRASVLDAVLENDAIAPGGGPWQGPAIAFTVTP